MSLNHIHRNLLCTSFGVQDWVDCVMICFRETLEIDASLISCPHSLGPILLGRPSHPSELENLATGSEYEYGWQCQDSVSLKKMGKQLNSDINWWREPLFAAMLLNKEDSLGVMGSGDSIVVGSRESVNSLMFFDISKLEAELVQIIRQEEVCTWKAYIDTYDIFYLLSWPWSLVNQNILRGHYACGLNILVLKMCLSWSVF